MSRELIRQGHDVVSTDLFEYPDPLVPVETGVDFLTAPRRDVGGVITNPPYRHNLAQKFVERALELEYPFVAMFTRITFLESEIRYRLFSEKPPSDVYFLCGRVNSSDEFLTQGQHIGGMVAYCWVVWDYRGRSSGHYGLHWIDTKSLYERWKAEQC